MGYLIQKNVSTFLSKLMIIAFLEQEHGPRNLVYKQEKKSFLQIPTLLSQNFISQSRPSSHTRLFSRHTQGNLSTMCKKKSLKVMTGFLFFICIPPEEDVVALKVCEIHVSKGLASG